MSLRDLSDEALLARVKRDPACFGPVYERHAEAILAYLRRRTPSVEIALDLTADVFTAALQAAPRFEAGETPVRAWLLGIANHKLIDSHRRAQTRGEALQRIAFRYPQVTPDDIEEVDRRLSDQAEGSLAMQLVAGLPEDQRAAVLARVVDEESYGEIAQRVGTTEVNVRTRVHRGLRRLAFSMNRAGGGSR